MIRPLFAAGLLLAVASFASSQSTPSPDEALSPMEILSSASLGPPSAPVSASASTLVSGTGTKSDAAQKPKANAGAAKSAATTVDPFEQCLRDWDAATHMTRQEWARTCRRVVNNRTKFMREQEGK
jgi:hypothetical protein